jgi:hypothetical protein
MLTRKSYHPSMKFHSPLAINDDTTDEWSVEYRQTRSSQHSFTAASSNGGLNSSFSYQSHDIDDLVAPTLNDIYDSTGVSCSDPSQLMPACRPNVQLYGYRYDVKPRMKISMPLSRQLRVVDAIPYEDILIRPILKSMIELR